MAQRSSRRAPAPADDAVEGADHATAAAASEGFADGPLPAVAGVEGEEVEEGDPPFLLRYSEALGKLLGPKLYDLVVKNTEVADLQGYALSALDSLFRSATRFASAQVPSEHAAEGAALEAELFKALHREANTALASPTGKRIAESISTAVGTHPTEVLIAILLAAVAAVAADVDTGTLAGKVGLGGGLSVEGMAKLGRIRHMSLDAIGATIRYQKKIEVGGVVDHSFDAQLSGGFERVPQTGAHMFVGGARFEYKGRGNLEQFLATYRHDHVEGVPFDEFKSHMKLGLGRLDAQLGGSMTLRQGQDPTGTADFTATYPVGHDMRLGGGATMTFGTDPSAALKTTMQVKHLQIDLGYDIHRDMWTVGLVLRPF